MVACRIAVSIACFWAISGRLSAAEPERTPPERRHQHPNPKAANEAAAGLVQAGLNAEAAGDQAARDQALDKALAAAPDFAPARWQKGQVRFEGKWTPFDAAQQAAARNPLFAEYRKLRDEVGGTIQGQTTLAHWCAKHKLTDEEQVHWRTILALEPENREAIKHLGLVRFEGVWVKPAQSMIFKKHAKQLKDARDHWMPICERLQHELDHGTDQARAQSAARLREINDPAAIRSMMNVLSIAGRLHGLEKPSIATNLLLVEVLGNMPQQEATNALLYEVLENPADEVALAVTDALKPRSLQSYVPVLLSKLESPVQGKYQIQTQPDGTIVYEHRYYRQGAQADELLVKELCVRPSSPILSTNTPGVAESYQMALAQVTAAAEQNQADVERRVAGAEKLKKRIESVLQRATGQEYGDSPSLWWQYWIDFNELFVPGDRALQQHSQRLVFTYFVPTPELFLAGAAGGGGGGAGGKGKGAGGFAVGQAGGATGFGANPAFPGGQGGGIQGLGSLHAGGRPFNMGWVYDPLYPSFYPPQTLQLPGMFLLPLNGWGVLAPTTCFGAGTLVATLAGPTPIEQIKVGDRVLSQDPETGELAYKPVLKTTVRPPAEMVTLAVKSAKAASRSAAREPNEQETFVSTKGHPFWVNGKGWQMTKNLESGNHLHTVTGFAEVESLEDADSVEAYNLVVDEFHTYFIGNSHVLVHDNSFAKPLLNSVPGLPQETEKTAR
jgi:hypothetical protein